MATIVIQHKGMWFCFAKTPATDPATLIGSGSQAHQLVNMMCGWGVFIQKCILMVSS